MLLYYYVIILCIGTRSIFRSLINNKGIESIVSLKKVLEKFEVRGLFL